VPIGTMPPSLLVGHTQSANACPLFVHAFVPVAPPEHVQGASLPGLQIVAGGNDVDNSVGPHAPTITTSAPRMLPLLRMSVLCPMNVGPPAGIVEGPPDRTGHGSARPSPGIRSSWRSASF
jgi:hypothetical protein